MNKPKGYRQLIIDQYTIYYKIGKSYVNFKGPLNGSVAFTLITGQTLDEIERGEWKKYFSITPGQIAEYVRKLLPDIKDGILNLGKLCRS